MAEQPRFVHVVDDLPDLSEAADGRLVLVHALEGFLDAGNAAALAARHLVAEDPGKVVASFDVDEFYDYRARRPALTFAEDHYEEYVAPRLVVRLVSDADGSPYLLLTGPEPDTRWEAFLTGVRAVVERLGVGLTLGMGSVPMAVPHTRPVMLTNHATSRHLLATENVWKGHIRVPSSAQALLEVRLGEWGHDAAGFVAHIPHYVAQLDYPTAAASLLESVGAMAGLRWDVEPLRRAGDAKLAEVNAQIAENPEVADVVRGLEQQYDAFARASAAETGSLPLAEEQDLPSGEELGAEFERFLAGLDRPDRPDRPEE